MTRPLDVLAEVASYVLLFLLMLGMSATVDSDNLIGQLRNRRAIGTGMAMQFVVMPLLGFVAVKVLNGFISPAVGITLLIVTASPGGSYSNWWCSLFNADLALSVAMTALSTLFSTFLLPINLLVYSRLAYGGRGGGGEGGGGDDAGNQIINSVDWMTLFVSLSVVLSAILLGLYASYRIKSARFHRLANHLGNASGILLIAFSLALSSGDEETRLWNRNLAFYVGVASPCLVGLVLSSLAGSVAKLKRPERVTLSVECCYQNVGIATSVAVSMFDDPTQRGEALCVPLFYGLVEAVVLGGYCLAAWKAGWTKAPRDERFCVMLGTSYEVGPAEQCDVEDSVAAPSKGDDGDKENATDADDGVDVDDIVTVQSSDSDLFNYV